MSLITIDESKCKKDGICAEECPACIIRQDPDSKLPVLSEEHEEACIMCGHCVAVCPHGALEHVCSPLIDSPVIQKELTLSLEQVEQLLRSRRSIRLFKPDPVEKEKMVQLIEMARYAPTGHNAEAVEWLVFNNKDKVDKIKVMVADWMKQIVDEKHPLAEMLGIAERLELLAQGRDIVMRGTSTLIVARGGSGALTAEQDVDIALSYLELAAMPLGLGTCWAGIITVATMMSPPVKEEMNLGDGYYYPMMVGYPKFKYKRQPKRKEPKITFI
jgi:nitroreductase/NAD-dependent dihydropyrimidine dehydrogenase PreA subunit